MSQDYQQFEKRKQDHIALALHESNQAIECHTLDSIKLIHEALPDINFDELSIATTRFGRKVKTPFMVSSMTAGHRDAVNINERLMAACAVMGWAMGVGSQRRELTDVSASIEWHALIKRYPSVSLLSNLGIAQLITSPIHQIQRLIEAINAEAIIIHCNPLQECIQPEGTPQFKGALQVLERLVKSIDKPVVVKETGCGFSIKTLQRLNAIGVAAVDVSGLGGTHWGRLEGARTKEDVKRFQTAQTFKNWGMTTLESVVAAASLIPRFEIWGSGGVRHGLDAAKLLALGAKTIGFAKLMLEAALQSEQAVITLMETIEYELKVALFCTGSASILALEDKVCR